MTFASENNQQSSVSPWFSIVVLATVVDKVVFPLILRNIRIKVDAKRKNGCLRLVAV